MILRGTGTERNGLPVLEEHGEAEEVVRVLSRGFTSTMLDLYAMEQTYLSRKEGPPPEPAYLLLSQNRGGFPRYGFFLEDIDKSGVGYVDLYESQQTAGRFGAVDQIFPHEMGHVILHQLAGPLQPGGSNQIHAVGLQTDPAYAFEEGFGEHFQIMVVDDPDVDPWTRALTFDVMSGSEAYVALSDYQRELTARWAPLTRRRMTFLLWYSGTEQVLRYHAVKANSFARQPQIANRLLQGDDPYRAYLLENVLPGQPGDPPKSFRRMIATEGVVAAFFHAWATNSALQEIYREDSFYEQFGTTAAEVEPLENVYLKLFHVLYEHKPRDVVALIVAYREVFPDETSIVTRLAEDVFLSQEMVTAPQIWLANESFQTGTSLYDQFRGLPRTHTFDLNAASEVDLISVPGVDRMLADMIRFRSPYTSVDDLEDVPGITHELLEEFRAMRQAMEGASSSTEELEAGLLLDDILAAYYWRMFIFLAPAALIAGIIYSLARLLMEARPEQADAIDGPRPDDKEEAAPLLPASYEPASSLTRPPWYRVLLNGIAATVVGTLGAASWSAAPILLSLLAVMSWLGLPAAAWTFWKTGDIRQAAAVFGAWLAAALPVTFLLTPLS